MYVPVHFLNANIWLCFALGYLTNGALLWLILYRTEVEARPYCPILLLSTCIDLVYLAVYALTVPLILISDAYGGMLALGVGATWLAPQQPGPFVLVSTWMFLFQFSFSAKCVPFLYRYAVICRAREWGLRHFLALLSMPAAYCAAISCAHVLTTYPTHLEPAQLQEAYETFFNDTFNKGHVSLPPYSFASIDDSDGKFVPVFALMLIMITYSIIGTCGWRIYHSLKVKTLKVAEERAREINRQVSQALLLQSFVPLVVEAVPTAAMGMVALTASDKGSSLMIYQTAFFAWAPVVSPLISMWVMRNYRQEVLNWLRCRLRASVQTTSVVMAIAAQQQPPQS